MKTLTEDDDMGEIFDSYIGKVVSVHIANTEKPIYGVLLRVAKKFIAMERRDGRIISISKDSIVRMQPTRTQFRPIHAGLAEVV